MLDFATEISQILSLASGERELYFSSLEDFLPQVAADENPYTLL